MIGIYKITNKINGHSYIGQSRNIQRRWQGHKENSKNINSKTYEYPLYKAFRKYGLENFIFEILEECSVEALNDREIYWIRNENPSYNQTEGGNYNIVPQKLSYEQVKEIQRILLDDFAGELSHIDLANKYGVHKDTIRDINVGRTWYDENLSYPLHLSKFDPRRKITQICKDCGKPITKKAIRCNACASKLRITEKPVTREELKKLIRTVPFTKIGAQFNVSDNTIRKWCDSYNLPRKVSEIKKLSDQEWDLI